MSAGVCCDGGMGAALFSWITVFLVEPTDHLARIFFYGGANCWPQLTGHSVEECFVLQDSRFLLSFGFCDLQDNNANEKHHVQSG